MTLKVQIAHSFGSFTLDLAFEAPPGVTVLFGASGSGKTSVINAVAGLLRADVAQISLNGRVLQDAQTFIPPHQRRAGYVFQDARLFPHMTVEANLRYGQRYTPKADHPPFDQIVELLGIGALLARRPGTLSGGEQSRVALGRALLSGPQILLADEPLAALDAPRKAEILPYFERLRDELQLPILYVTHAADEVARLATTVIALEAGRITAKGSVAEVLANPDVAPAGIRQLGAVLTATLTAQHDDGLTELDAGGLPLLIPAISGTPGETKRLRLPAQDVILSLEPPQGLSAQNILPGRIAALRTGDGPGIVAVVDTPAGPILSRITKRSATRLGLAEGMAVHCIAKTVAIAPGDAG